MPFITIELPDTLQFSLHSFAQKVHTHLNEALDIPVEKLKTKLLRLSEVYVGHGDPLHTYANVKIELMAGRDRQKLINAANVILEYFTEALQEQNPDCNCRVTCEFREIDPQLLVAAQIPKA